MGFPPHRLQLSLGRGRGAGSGGRQVRWSPPWEGPGEAAAGPSLFLGSLGLTSLQERSGTRLLNLLQICGEAALFSAFRSRAPSRAGREACWTVSKAPGTMATEAGLPVALLPEGGPCDACSREREARGSASGILQCCLCCAAPSRISLPLHTDAGQIPAHLSEAPGRHHSQKGLLLDPPVPRGHH